MPSTIEMSGISGEQERIPAFRELWAYWMWCISKQLIVTQWDDPCRYGILGENVNQLFFFCWKCKVRLYKNNTINRPASEEGKEYQRWKATDLKKYGACSQKITICFCSNIRQSGRIGVGQIRSSGTRGWSCRRTREQSFWHRGAMIRFALQRPF